MVREEAIQRWLNLPEEFRGRVIAHLNKELSPQFHEGLTQAFENDPNSWWAEGGWHFGQGMGIRNLLRQGGFTDDQLPLGNWDEYYIQALEDANGLL